MKSHWLKLILFLFVLQISSFAANYLLYQLDNRPFTLRNTSGTTGDNIYGDINVTGAPIMCVAKSNHPTQCDWSYSGYLYNATGLYLTDSSDHAFITNSSQAKLVIPTDATITKAYLYWSGHVYGTTATQSAYNSATANFNSVTFQTPDGVDHNVTAADDGNHVNKYTYINNINGTHGFRLFYQAIADVTSLVQNGGYDPTKSNQMSFTVGNLKATAGADTPLYEPLISTDNVYWGPMGGWSLVVEYTRPVASGQKYKNVSIFDGFKFIVPNFGGQTVNVDINVSGFLTPLSTTPTGTFAFYTMGSERQITGERVQIANKSGTLNNLYNSLNLVGSQLNDTISLNGTTLNHDFNPGIDLDTFEVSTSCKTSGGATVACLDRNQTSTSLRLGITSGSNSSDQSIPGMIALSLDIYQPNISSFLKESNTSITQQLNPGDTVKYTLDFNNSGTEAASKVTIYDTFSSTSGGDMLLNIIDRNSTAMLNSIRLYPYGQTAHCAIGSTDPACATLSKDANCSVDYADNNTSKATKVWCNIPYMAVNDRYIMTFNATIRSDYNQSLPEQNVTNVAYSQYYNAETGELVTQQGQSNINTAGTVGGATPYAGKLDVVDYFDNTYSYNSPVGLKTKVAGNTNTTLTAVYLGTDASNYHPSIYTGGTYDMLVLFTLSDDSCTENNPISSSGDVTATFVSGANQYTAVSNPFTVISKAKKIGRVKANFIDWNKINFSGWNGNNCVSHASINGNLKGVPECINGNSDKITNMFTYDVSTCVTAVGSYQAPCDSNAYNASGSKGNIYPQKYNNTYGCLMCLSDAVNGANNCSQDNFAIRPNKFIIDSTSTNFPNLLRAARPYNASFTAVDASNVATLDYNQTAGNLTTNSTKWLNTSPYTVNGTNGVTLPYAGDVDVSTVNFLNGLSQTGSAFKYADVGMMDMNVTDQNWAAVDADDTPGDCSATGRYICGDVNVTFIPDHFDFNTTTIINNDGPAIATNQFTYLSNQLDQMAARIQGTLRSLNADNNVTLNFGAAPLWENNVTVTPSVHTSAYIYPDANVSGITSMAIGFSSGVKDINWSETNSSKYLRFNFQRDANRSVDPFVTSISDMNLSVNSHYTQSVTGRDSSADINGSQIGANSGSATFLYGRTHAPRYRYIGNTGNAQIFYEVYCDTAGNKSLLPAGSIGDSDSVNWYLNINHIYSSDGNITAIAEKNSLGKVTGTLPTTSSFGSSSTTLLYNATQGYPYKTTMQVTPSGWLVYDPYNIGATTNDFDVEFYQGATNWTGHHDNNTTVDELQNQTNKPTSKRILW